MARIRTVKPELFRHEGLYELELETGLPVRFSFAGLFTACDRRGRFKWKPRQLKLDVLPYDNLDFSRVLDALASRGFIVKYENLGEIYGCIPTFETHQVINNRESESLIPSLDEDASLAIDINDNSTRQSRVSHAPFTPLVHDKAEGKGKEQEGKGREGIDHASVPDDVVSVFEHWSMVMSHPKAKLDDTRKNLIKKAIKLGYSVDDLKNSITGYSYSPFHMGQNYRQTKFDGLDLILKNGSKIDAGLEFFSNPPQSRFAGQTTVDDFHAQVAGVVDRTKHLIEDYPDDDQG